MDSKWERVLPYISLDSALVKRMMSNVKPGEEVKRFNLIKKGLRNSNYCVEYDDCKFLLRVYGTDDYWWKKEKAVFEHVKEKVRVPELLDLNSEFEIIDKPFAVFEYVEGCTLDEYLNQGACGKNVISEIGRSLAAIHETSYSQVGFLDENLKVAEELPDLRSWYDIFLNDNATRKLGERLTEEVRNYIRSNNENINRINESIAFVHNDFRPINIIIDQNERPYLIDWEGAMAGHVLGDIGQFLRFEQQITSQSEKLFIDSYNYYSRNKLPQDYKELARLRDLVNLLQLLNSQCDLQNKDGDLIELIRKTCSCR